MLFHLKVVAIANFHGEFERHSVADVRQKQHSRISIFGWLPVE
jgi:Rps23 Pro-64 3,4-dihydroxylase Tpa1-like proline 4-hydroxylase